jgi:hypothetical protein
MIRICAWYGKNLGEKHPLEIEAITHTICYECYKKETEPYAGADITDSTTKIASVSITQPDGGTVSG